MTNVRYIEALKAQGNYWAAGYHAHMLGCSTSYGCHYGMRSERDRAIQEYVAGWFAAHYQPSQRSK